MKTVQQYVYAYGNWYLNGIQQVQHNWGFFGFVPNAIIRFTFDKKVDDMWIPIKEYTQIQSPYFGHHNQFNFFRGMVEDEKNYSEHINRWLLYFCADENIRDTDIQLSKKYAFFPKEEVITSTTWRNWKPYWQSMPVTTIHCP